MSEAVIISLVSLAGTIVTPLLILLLNYKLNGIHKQLNSRMDELIAAAFAKGIAQEKNRKK